MEMTAPYPTINFLTEIHIFFSISTTPCYSYWPLFIVPKNHSNTYTQLTASVKWFGKETVDHIFSTEKKVLNFCLGHAKITPLVVILTTLGFLVFCFKSKYHNQLIFVFLNITFNFKGI